MWNYFSDFNIWFEQISLRFEHSSMSTIATDITSKLKNTLFFKVFYHQRTHVCHFNLSAHNAFSFGLIISTSSFLMLYCCFFTHFLKGHHSFQLLACNCTPVLMWAVFSLPCQCARSKEICMSYAQLLCPRHSSTPGWPHRHNSWKTEFMLICLPWQLLKFIVLHLSS